jgi:hypothetical protein
MNLEQLPGQAACLDESGQIKAVNQAWIEFSGRARGLGGRPSLGASYRELVASEDGPLIELLDSVLQGKVAHGTQEYSCFEDVQRKHFLATVWRIDDGVVVLHLDVTPEVAARRRWAHDLNNSMTALLCYLNLGLPMLENDSAAREFLLPAEEAARQLLGLMDQRPV